MTLLRNRTTGLFFVRETGSGRIRAYAAVPSD
jgi:hypothetical protein